jgi:predicted peroxiredoxin
VRWRARWPPATADDGGRLARRLLGHDALSGTTRWSISDIPPSTKFVELIADTGAGLYACKASVDLFGLEKNDLIPQVQDIITVGEFYEMAAGGEMLFT